MRGRTCHGQRSRAWLNGIQFGQSLPSGYAPHCRGDGSLSLPAGVTASGAASCLGLALGSARRLCARACLRILGIVTAFTIGHSITLSLAALGFVNVPSRPVEALIAVSILVSAVHASVPIFPGKEAWIAAFLRPDSRPGFRRYAGPAGIGALGSSRRHFGLQSGH